MAERNGFIVHFDSFKYFSRLSDEQLGKLFRAVCKYAKSGEQPQFDDDVTDIIFEMLRDRLNRDAEKYEEICKKNAENAKKGGRPRKTERFFDETEKTERFFEKPKKPNSDSDSDSDPDCECECECECECDPESACADGTAHTTTTHTPRTAEDLTEEYVLELAASQGFTWTPEEAERFIAFNIDRRRRGGWEYAVGRWERGRATHESGNRGASDLSEEDIEKASKYIALVNRFKEDDQDAV